MALRGERAKLLGFATYADYRLADQMAKTPEAARKLLDDVWAARRAKAQAERDALQDMIKQEGGNFELARARLALLRREAAQGEIRSR